MQRKTALLLTGTDSITVKPIQKAYNASILNGFLKNNGALRKLY
jgi:hypothetical protein